MAKSIDEIVLKATVEGQASLDQATQSLKNLEKSSESASSTLKGLRFQNVAYQLQDMAVQAQMGTSWFTILGQQLPQLLSGFGPLGAAVGTIAAVGLPLLSVALKNSGIDMRSVKEITTDLTRAINDSQQAQRDNSQNLALLAIKYGEAAAAAKTFFEARQAGSDLKVEAEIKAQIIELKNTYDIYSGFIQDRAKKNREALGIPQDYDGGLSGFIRNINRSMKGLTEEQSKELSKRLKDIDKASPQETLDTLNGISKYLVESSKGSDKFLQTWEKTIAPILAVNEALVKQKENIRAAADASSKLSTSLLEIQNQYQPDINKAKRNFDQITAIRLEGEQKVDELKKQIANKEGTISSDVLKKEKAAGLLRIQQETNDKVKDFEKNQSEAYKAITLTNEGKVRSLELESQLNKLSDEQRYTLSYQLQYEQDIARNRKEYLDTTAAIEEQHRKGLITTEAEAKAYALASAIRDKADKNAEEVRQKRINDAKDANNVVLFELDAKQRSIGYDIESLKLRAEMRNSYSEDIDTAVKITALKNAQAEAEIRLNREVELGKISSEDALDRLIAGRQELEKAVELEKARYAEAARYRTATFGEGMQDAVAKMTRDNLTSYQQGMKMVESIYSNLGDALDKFVETGKFKFADFRKAVVQDLLKIQLRVAATNAISGGLGLFGLSLPGRASGGPVTAGNPYVIGEQGPELFIPSSSGTIIPNATSSGTPIGNTQVVYNISAVDARSFKELVAADPSFLYAVSEQGRRRIPGAR